MSAENPFSQPNPMPSERAADALDYVSALRSVQAKEHEAAGRGLDALNAQVEAKIHSDAATALRMYGSAVLRGDGWLGPDNPNAKAPGLIARRKAASDALAEAQMQHDQEMNRLRDAA